MRAAAPGLLAVIDHEGRGGRARGLPPHQSSYRFALAVTSEEKAGGLAVASGATDVQHRPLGKVREQAEREHIISVLRLTNGNRIQAAQILGISRKTLWKKLKHLGVSWPPTITQG